MRLGSEGGSENVFRAPTATFPAVPATTASAATSAGPVEPAGKLTADVRRNSIEEAVRLANEGIYGLSAAVMAGTM